MSRFLRYLERCSGSSHRGDAWIGYVEMSRTLRTAYFHGRGFQRAIGGMRFGNYFDVETGAAYWISGVKKRGTNRHWAGSGRIAIESIAVEEFLEHTGELDLDHSAYNVVDAFPRTDRERIRKFLNATVVR